MRAWAGKNDGMNDTKSIAPQVIRLLVLTLCLTNIALAKTELPRTGVTIDNGVIAITQSDAWGGAVVSLKFKGAEFIDVQDAGRELQFSEYCKVGWKAFTTDGYTFTPKARIVINPNQAGDASAQNSKVLYSRRVNETTLESACIPREWFTRDWPGLRMRKGAQFDNSRFISRLTILPGFRGQVIRLDCQFLAPVPGSWHAEIPALYLLAHYNQFYGVDAGSNQVNSLTTTGIKATHYVPLSKIGGIIATTASGQKTIGIYGAWESHKGSIGSAFLCYTFGKNCTKLGVSSASHPLAVGETANYRSYIVVGKDPADVINLMQSLYQAGLR